MSSAAAPARAFRAEKWAWFALLVAVFVAWEFAALARVPFLSEDWTHLEEGSSIDSLFSALALWREPLRPFQHAYFWLLAHSGLDVTTTASPAIARAPIFALHAGSCVLVFALACAVGLARRDACIAACLFALFPNAKSISWPAAVGNPGRVFFELAACVCFVLHARGGRSRPLLPALGLASFALALGFHESAMLFPAIVCAWIVLANEGGMSAGWRALVARRRDPWSVAVAIGGAGYFAYLAFLRPQRHHEWKTLAATAANGVKAALALVPEPLRALAVEGLRTPEKRVQLAVAVMLLLLVAGLAVYCCVRSRSGRFLVVAVALEFALPCLGLGFVQRYAYFSAALVAIGLAAWSARGGRAWVLALVACAWAYDSAVDVLEIRAAGRVEDRIVAVVRDTRARLGPGEPIALLNVPDMGGSEQDIALLNWGADWMLARHGIAGPLVLWRTRPFKTSTSVVLVEPAVVESARARGTPYVIDCDTIDVHSLRK